MTDWRADEIPEDRVADVCRRMLREFRPIYDAIRTRREHYYTYETVDPDLSSKKGNDPDPNDLLSQANRFQSREIAITSKRLIDRITENAWQLTDQAPDETASLEKTGNNIAQVLNSWGIEIEDRQEMGIQRALTYPCVRDKGYAVLHVRRCEDLWPEVDWSYNEKDGAGIEQYEEEVECPGCGGEMQEGEPCPQCAGEGVYRRSKLTFRGTGKGYVDQVQYEYAKRGAPWTWESVDPLNFAWSEDRDPRGGMKRALVHYEVNLEEYCDALGSDYEPKVHELRKAFRLPGDQHSETAHSTPSSEEYEGIRGTVYQLWTRTHLYEWVGYGQGGPPAAIQVKGGPHGYPRIPFRIVAPRRTGHADLMWRYEGDLDDMYAIKEWIDFQVSLMGGVMLNTTRPLLNDTVEEPGKTPYLADGTPHDGTDNGTVGSRQPVAGMKTEVISQPMPASIPAFWQELKEMNERAKPETGDVPVDASSQAWAIRLGQAQSGKGPRSHIKEHAAALQWAFQLIMDWHEQQKERMVAFGRDQDTRLVSKAKPIVIDPAELRYHQPNVFINEVSAAERQMEEEFARGLLAEQLITHEDFYRIRGARDPKDEALKVLGYWTAFPYIQQAAQGRIAERMSSTFLMGVNGEMLNSAGQLVGHEQVLQAKGYQPGAPPTGPGGGAGGAPPMNGNLLGQIRGQASMPALPGLNVGGGQAGVAPMPGIPG